MRQAAEDGDAMVEVIVSYGGHAEQYEAAGRAYGVGESLRRGRHVFQHFEQGDDIEAGRGEGEMLRVHAANREASDASGVDCVEIGDAAQGRAECREFVGRGGVPNWL
ncbi:MAG: hypothetical protein U0R19_02515 [Bryobacteraceae bacterium]